MISRPTGTVTFLFTDIEGSTRLAREQPETWEALRSRHHEILHEAVEANNGIVFQIIGDAFCAAFYTAGEALKAAIQAQHGLQREAWKDCILRVRMGIHTGEAEARGNDYHGYLTLSLVQRVMSAGHGGQVLLTGATEMLLRGQMPQESSLRDMGEHKFKDVPYPIRVFQLVTSGLQNEFPALRALDIIPNNLPTQLTSFIGREKEVADIKNLLGNTHLLTLIGPGGTGKTRLSLQAGTDLLHSYPHGVWLIELAPVSDPAAVPAAGLAALDLPSEVHRPAIEMLSDFLREKEALLILDNCEHLVDACARMVDRLLHAAPKLRILASSREALGIAGEVSYRVPSLGLPDIKQLPPLDSLSQYEAVRLFIDRARAAQPSFHVTNENAPAVAQICYRLDGIPLALELAAAKVRALSVDQIAKRLDDRFRLLTGGNRTALERHQTLRATLDWSYNLLPAPEQILFRRLSTFVNGWTLEAAESVCSDELIPREDVFDVLEQLVNKSLVLAQEWKDETRYSMLETMRQYAGEKLIESGESEKLHDRHLNYYLELAETAEPHLIRPEQIIWLDRLEADHDNLRQSLEWALGKESAEPALRLSAALGQFWDIQCYWLEGAQWLERALQKPFDPGNASEKRARIRALYQDSNLAQELDILERHRKSAEESLALAETGTDRRELAIARFYVALAYMWMWQLEDQKAYELFEKSASDFHELNDPYWEGRCRSYILSLLEASKKINNFERTKGTMEFARKSGECVFLAEALKAKAFWDWENYRWEEAEACLDEVQHIQEEIGYKGYGPYQLYGLLAHSQGNFSQAKEYYDLEIQHLALIGEKNNRSFTLHWMARLSKDEGDFLRAREYINQALELGREIRGELTIAIHCAFSGYLHLQAGKLQEAKNNFIETLKISTKLDHSFIKWLVLVYLAMSIPDRLPEHTVQILAALDTYYSKIEGTQPLEPIFRMDREHAIAQARIHLGELAFKEAWNAGEKMSLDDAIDLAIKIVEEL
jgi:predicted ATPase/class 3 adenylate cyclase